MIKRFIAVILILLAVVSCYSPHPNTSALSKTNNIEAYFSSGDKIQQRIIEEIGKAKKSIDIAIFDFDSEGIAHELKDAKERGKDAKERGVEIRIIMDRRQYKSNPERSQYEYCKRNNFKPELKSVKGGGIMHHKFIIFDDTLLMTGSYNLTGRAEGSNYENVVFISDKSIIEKYKEEFNNLWKKVEKGKK